MTKKCKKVLFLDQHAFYCAKCFKIFPVIRSSRPKIFYIKWSVISVFILHNYDTNTVQFRRTKTDDDDIGNSRRDVVKIMITDLDKVNFGAKDMLMCLLKIQYFTMPLDTNGVNYSSCLANT